MIVQCVLHTSDGELESLIKLMVNVSYGMRIKETFLHFQHT